MELLTFPYIILKQLFYATQCYIDIKCNKRVR